MKQKIAEMAQQAVAQHFEQDATSVLFAMTAAKRVHSALVAGSRVEVLCLRKLDRYPVNLDEVRNWEALRTLELPWIQDLSVEEILRVRAEAARALPRLRVALSKRLQAATEQADESVPGIVAELQAEALDVEAELESLRLPSERRYRAEMGSLAFAFVIYGLASGVPQIAATSIAGLLATLAHLRTAERDTECRETKLRSQPAYVLLRAKEVLAEREQVP